MLVIKNFGGWCRKIEAEIEASLEYKLRNYLIWEWEQNNNVLVYVDHQWTRSLSMWFSLRSFRPPLWNKQSVFVGSLPKVVSFREFD